VSLAPGNVRDAAPRTASAPEPSEEQALPRPRTLLPCVAGAPAPLQSRDAQTTARTMDDKRVRAVRVDQTGRSIAGRCDDQRPPGTRCAPDRRGTLEDSPRRTANSVRRDRGIQRRASARSPLGQPARRRTRTRADVAAAAGSVGAARPLFPQLGPFGTVTVRARAYARDAAPDGLGAP
jgi:hypothetical protein